jgi:phosphate transport system permease protein
MTRVEKQQAVAFTCLGIAALITVIILFAIVSYIMFNGLAVINKEFLLDSPREMGSEGGIFPAIIGTVYLVGATMLIATPIGVGAAIYLNEYTRPSTVTNAIRFATDALAGIPSIVFGLFGFLFFVIILRPYTGGWSIISGAFTGVIMILPLIVRSSEEALKAVSDIYREGSLALGTTRWQTIKRVVLPIAFPGILTGLILSIGRVIGETAAFLLTLGGTLLLPGSIYDGGRTLSLHLYMVAMETGAMHIAFGTGAILIILVIIINATANWILKKVMTKGIS